MGGEMNLADLKKPFHPDEIEWRIAQSGMTQQGKPWAQVLAYLQSRAIMDRLDDVCGPANWRNEFVKAPDGGTICKLYIRVDNEWISKEDGADNTQVEAVKGGLSSAMKRAGVPWGIGRYLYRLDAGWAVFAKGGKYKSAIKDKKTGKQDYFEWNPPELPAWALPEGAVVHPVDNGEKLFSADWEIVFDKEVNSPDEIAGWKNKHWPEIKKLPEVELKKLQGFIADNMKRFEDELAGQEA
jgi:hypothetical protein